MPVTLSKTSEASLCRHCPIRCRLLQGCCKPRYSRADTAFELGSTVWMFCRPVLCERTRQASCGATRRQSGTAKRWQMREPILPASRVLPRCSTKACCWKHWVPRQAYLQPIASSLSAAAPARHHYPSTRSMRAGDASSLHCHKSAAGLSNVGLTQAW